MEGLQFLLTLVAAATFAWAVGERQWCNRWSKPAIAFMLIFVIGVDTPDCVPTPPAYHVAEIENPNPSAP